MDKSIYHQAFEALMESPKRKKENKTRGKIIFNFIKGVK
jgi:hypothetical protein